MALVKKKSKIIPLTLLLLVGVIVSVLLWEEELPEPSADSIKFVESEFAGLTLDESIRQIKSNKKDFDFFTQFTEGNDVYGNREIIPTKKERYKKAFSILSSEDYHNAYTEAVNTISFRQRFFYGYSLIDIDIDKLSSKNQPTITIKKITYMDGTEDQDSHKIKGVIKLENNKTVKQIDAVISYTYITELEKHLLTIDKPKIQQDEFTLKLTKINKNYLSYTLDGNLAIAGKDITDKNGHILDDSSCSTGGIGFEKNWGRFMDDIYKLSKQPMKDKDELIHRVAAYYERFDRATDKPMTYLSECLYKGTPTAITVYAIKDKKKEKNEVQIIASNPKLYPVVEDEKTNTFYIFDQNGNEIVNHGNTKLYTLAFPYFASENQKKNSDDDKIYYLYQLDQENKRLEIIAEVNDFIYLSNKAFATETNSEVTVYNNTLSQPVVIPVKNSYLRTFGSDGDQYPFFYFKDDDKYYVINDKGQTIIPVENYQIKGGGQQNWLIEKKYFGLDKSKNKDNKFYYLNYNGELILTLSGYDDAEAIRNDMIHVERDELHGFTDLTGTEIIPLIYERARRFDNGYALVRRDSFWGVINKQGDIVIPFKYANHSGWSTSNDITSYRIGDHDYTMNELLEANGL